MRLLLTGASGFLGLNLTRDLGRLAGIEELLATDLTLHEPEEWGDVASPKTRFLPLDVTDRRAVTAAITEFRPSHIVHAAALTPRGTLDAAGIARVFDVNLGGSLNLFEAAVSAGVERLVFLSSSGVYAQGAGDIRHEDDPLALDQPYAGSKRAAEIASLSFCGSTDIVCARIGPVYGPMERARPTRPNVSFVGKLQAALAGSRSVTVSGPDITRDWTHAADIARGIALLLTTPTLRHRIYNLSAGAAHSGREVVDTFALHGLAATWTDGEADIAQTASDIRVPLSIARITADTGFSPSHTLATGIADLVAAGRTHFIHPLVFQEA